MVSDCDCDCDCDCIARLMLSSRDWIEVYLLGGGSVHTTVCSSRYIYIYINIVQTEIPSRFLFTNEVRLPRRVAIVGCLVVSADADADADAANNRMVVGIILYEPTDTTEKLKPSLLPATSVVVSTSRKNTHVYVLYTTGKRRKKPNKPTRRTEVECSGFKNQTKPNQEDGKTPRPRCTICRSCVPPVQPATTTNHSSWSRTVVKTASCLLLVRTSTTFSCHDDELLFSKSFGTPSPFDYYYVRPFSGTSGILDIRNCTCSRS